MDRGSFFQALSFLSPVSSSLSSSSGISWPPNSKGCSTGNDVVVLFKDCMLSVEPVEGKPAYFAAHGVDPAMFRVDICLLESMNTPKSATSPAASSVSTSLSMSQSSPKSHKNSSVGKESESNKLSPKGQTSVVLQIDKTYIFQINLAELQRVEVDGDQQQENATTIPSIRLLFEDCCFRVFTEQGLSPTSSPDFFATLQAAAERLQKAIALFQSTTHMQIEYSTGSLLQNSESSGTENGQCDRAAMMRRVKRNRTALDCSWDGLQLLQAVLDMPHKAMIPNGITADSLGPLLNATADDLSSSYGRGRNVLCALQDCNDTIVANEQELEQVFVAAFPPPRTKHSRRSPAAKIAMPDSADAVESTEALREITLELLQQHKEQVRLRLELSLLPIRDS